MCSLFERSADGSYNIDGTGAFSPPGHVACSPLDRNVPTCVRSTARSVLYSETFVETILLRIFRSVHNLFCFYLSSFKVGLWWVLSVLKYVLYLKSYLCNLVWFCIDFLDGDRILRKRFYYFSDLSKTKTFLLGSTVTESLDRS